MRPNASQPHLGPATRQFMWTVEFLQRYPQTCLTTYETLLEDFPAWLAQVQAHLGWTDEQATSVGAGLEAELRPPEREDPHEHKRRMTPGNWREVFDDRLRRLFEKQLGAHLADAGYGW